MTFEARLPSISDAIAIRLDLRDERVPSTGIEVLLKAWRCLSVASLYDCISGEAETSKLVRLVSIYLRVYEKYTSFQRSFSRIRRTMELSPHWPSLRGCELGFWMLLPWWRCPRRHAHLFEAKMGKRYIYTWLVFCIFGHAQGMIGSQQMRSGRGTMKGVRKCRMWGQHDGLSNISNEL